jgi:hypothetical protein
MNIFILDRCPAKAARMLCNKHVVKMITESGQLLCNKFWECGIEAYYSKNHYNYPVSLWTRQSSANFLWLLEHAKVMCEEYTNRYHRRHKVQDIIEWCESNFSRLTFKQSELTPFTLAMPDKYKQEDAVLAYRDFYVAEKAYFAKWFGPKPEWWPFK